MKVVYSIKTDYDVSAVIKKSKDKYIVEVEENHGTGFSCFSYECYDLDEAVLKANEYVFKEMFL